MLCTRAAQLQERDVENFAWSSLRQFHHVPTTAARMMQLHCVPEKFKPNVVKQAEHIRFCLIQAQEFREAAKSVSLATKPVLLYYSIMNLALAQILFNGDGDVSLDRARAEHAHHGLSFTIGPVAKNQYSLSLAAASLRARPMLDVNGRRRGTFELWCRQSREDPLAGNCVQMSGSLQTSGMRILMAAQDTNFCFLAENGITLLDCFEALPMLKTNIYHLNRTIRANLSLQLNQNSSKTTLILHPHYDKKDLDNVINAFKFAPHLINYLDIREGGSGLAFTLENKEDTQGYVYFPPACTWSVNEIRFLPPKYNLNEFGYLYLALYILGNYARYYPDRWVADVEQGTHLSLLSSHLLSLVDLRMSILTLNDLSGILYIV